MAETTIEWTRSPTGEKGYTFNGWEGCQKVSPGCDNCYAEARNNRFAAGENWGPGAPRRRTSVKNWNLPKRWNKEAQAKGIRLRVFTASISDWLDNAVPIDWTADLLFQVMVNDSLDWLMLSKRIGVWHSRISACIEVASTEDGMQRWPGLAAWLQDWVNGKAPSNVFLGASIVNQEEANRDIPKLLATPAAKRFLSMEPLLSAVDLFDFIARSIPVKDDSLDAPDGAEVNGMERIGNEWRRKVFLDWVIVGGESDKGARPMHPRWVKDLHTQCHEAGIAFMFKQWGEWANQQAAGLSINDCYEKSREGGWIEFDGRFTVGEAANPVSADAAHVFRIGKTHSGRVFEGQILDEVPA